MATTVLTPAQAGKASTLPRKPYAQLQQEASSLSFINFHISHSDGRSENIDRKQLSDDDFSTYVHDIMKIPKEICIAYDYFPGAQNMKFIQVKPEIDVSKYTQKQPIPFKDFLIEIGSSKSSVTKVTFLYAGLDIPNEEILNLCDQYGEPVLIEFAKMNTSKNKGDKSAKRVVWMKLAPNKVMKNYYWLESMVPNRPACRVLVLHEGQGKQCNHCLNIDMDCPAGAEGKQCRVFNKTPKRDAASYMFDLKRMTGYKSLREKHQLEFPSLTGDDKPFSSYQEDKLQTGAGEEQERKIENLTSALSKENEKTEAAVELLREERHKAETLLKQQVAVANSLDNLIVDFTNDNPTEILEPGSKLDQLLTMRAESSLPTASPDPFEDAPSINTLSEVLVDQSSPAQALQKQCVQAIHEKVKCLLKNRQRRMSFSNTELASFSSADVAHKLLENSPSRAGRYKLVSQLITN